MYAHMRVTQLELVLIPDAGRFCAFRISHLAAAAARWVLYTLAESLTLIWFIFQMTGSSGITMKL